MLSVIGDRSSQALKQRLVQVELELGEAHGQLQSGRLGESGQVKELKQQSRVYSKQAATANSRADVR